VGKAARKSITGLAQICPRRKVSVEVVVLHPRERGGGLLDLCCATVSLQIQRQLLGAFEIAKGCCHQGVSDLMKNPALSVHHIS